MKSAIKSHVYFKIFVPILNNNFGFLDVNICNNIAIYSWNYGSSTDNFRPPF